MDCDCGDLFALLWSWLLDRLMGGFGRGGIHGVGLGGGLFIQLVRACLVFGVKSDAGCLVVGLSV